MSRMYNILNAIITPFGKTLWTGKWANGSITVPDTDKYSLFLADPGSQYYILVVKGNSTVTGCSVAPVAVGNQYIRSLNATINGNTWTMVAAKQVPHMQGSTHGAASDITISKIIGLVPDFMGGVQRNRCSSCHLEMEVAV